MKSDDLIEPHEDDQLVEITEGPYKGHEGILRKMASGELAIMVLEKIQVLKGPVKVIDVLEVKSDEERSWLQQPSVH